MLNFDIIPRQASTYAEWVDPLFYILVAMTVVMVTGIFIVLGIMAWKFRYIEGENRPSKPLESVMLEITWTVIPTIVFLGFFVWGVILYNRYLTVPKEGTVEIEVVAKQWMWKLRHSGGRREVNELHIPVGVPIELTMTSLDVLHGFYVPSFRVKQDVVPGRYTKLWFEPTKTGVYKLLCAEYCGTDHSTMGGAVYVMEPDDYAEWLAGGPKKSPVEAGEFLFALRGCATCHSGLPGSRGPDLNGVFGSEVRLMTGETVTADDAYMVESILDSAAKIVEGYTPLMPNFSNQLSSEEVTNLVAYLKSIGAKPEVATAE